MIAGHDVEFLSADGFRPCNNILESIDASLGHNSKIQILQRTGSSDWEPQEILWWWLSPVGTSSVFLSSEYYSSPWRHIFLRTICSGGDVEMSTGRPKWFQISWLRGSPAPKTTRRECPHYVPPWTHRPKHQETTYFISSQSLLHASPMWLLNPHSRSILTIFTVLPGVACQAGTFVRSGFVKEASAIMETGRRGTCCKRKGNFPQRHCGESISSSQGLSLAFCSLLAIFLLLLLDPHYRHLRMPKIGAYLMLFDIFKGPRSMLLWSEKPKANINRHTTGLKWKHAFTPPIKTPGETGVLRQL